MNETKIHRICQVCVSDGRYTAAMRCGPPKDWEINISPDEDEFAAIFTRPDNEIRVQLRGVTDYYVEVAGRVEEVPYQGWISRKEDAADHIIEGYARMCLEARKVDKMEPPEFDEKTTHDGREQYKYDWGLKRYNVVIE